MVLNLHVLVCTCTCTCTRLDIQVSCAHCVGSLVCLHVQGFMAFTFLLALSSWCAMHMSFHVHLHVCVHTCTCYTYMCTISVGGLTHVLHCVCVCV